MPKDQVTSDALSKQESQFVEKAEKIYILDTCVFINDPESPRRIVDGGNLLVMPWRTFAELDKHRKNPDCSREAKKVIRELKKLQSENAPVVFMAPNWQGVKGNGIKWANTLDENNPDDEIIGTALSAYKRYGLYNKPIHFVTDDFGPYIKAKEIKVKGQPCLIVQEWDRKKGDSLDSFKAPVIEVESIDEIKRHKYQAKSFLPNAGAYNNCGILIKAAEQYDAAFGVGNDGISAVGIIQDGRIKLLKHDSSIYGIKQKSIPGSDGSEQINWEQIIAINLALDEKLPYLSLIGPAGTGKTLFAMALACLGIEKGWFNKVYITRPPISVGKHQGALPGDLDEKLSPWMMGMTDNLREVGRLTGKTNRINDWLTGKEGARKRIEILSYEHIRGRNIVNCLVIIDETQNMKDEEEAKTFTTRLNNSRMVLIGDPEQRDNRFSTETKNGLILFSSIMKGSSKFGYVFLTKCVRDEAVAEVLERFKIWEESH